MAVYTFTGLCTRSGSIPLYVFHPKEGDGKPVVTMKACIVINGITRQKKNQRKVLSLLQTIENFKITEVHRTKSNYDYACLVESVNNNKVPEFLTRCVTNPGLTYYGVLIEYDSLTNTFTVGCSERVFTNATSRFCCFGRSLVLPSVKIKNSNVRVHGSLCEHEVKITAIMDCVCGGLVGPRCSPENDSERWCAKEPARASELIKQDQERTRTERVYRLTSGASSVIRDEELCVSPEPDEPEARPRDSIADLIKCSTDMHSSATDAKQAKKRTERVYKSTLGASSAMRDEESRVSPEPDEGNGRPRDSIVDLIKHSTDKRSSATHTKQAKERTEHVYKFTSGASSAMRDEELCDSEPDEQNGRAHDSIADLTKYLTDKRSPQTHTKPAQEGSSTQKTQTKQKSHVKTKSVSPLESVTTSLTSLTLNSSWKDQVPDSTLRPSTKTNSPGVDDSLISKKNADLDFEALKPTIPEFERTFKGFVERQMVVTAESKADVN